jgi:uncharacterized protein (DUF58 family)
MLEFRGRILLAIAVGLVAAGVLLSLAGAVLAGVVLILGLTGELLRIRAATRPRRPPLGVTARMTVHDARTPSGETRLASHRAGKWVPLRFRLDVPDGFASSRLDLLEWWTSPGIDLTESVPRSVLLPSGGVELDLQALALNAAVHRILGVHGRLTDPAGLVSVPVFLPSPCEIAVLPRSLPIDLRRVAETRRMAPRSAGAQRPDKVQGPGDDLRELREHVPGDPFKHIAWKASARRGRLMSRSFERERTRSLYVVLDTGSTMRDGRPGRGPLDQAMDLVHSLAEASARGHDPFGLALVDGRVVDQRPVLEGVAAIRDADRALLDIRRAVADDLTPLEEDELTRVVAGYLTAVERVPLPADGEDPHVREHFRQRLVMAALARLPERERLPMLRGPEPSARPDLAILRRFCRAMDLTLPYRTALSPPHRVEGLVEGVAAAMAARKGPFAIVIISDFRRLSGGCGPLWLAFARARAAGNRVLAVAVREVEERDVLDLVPDANDADTARGLLQADAAARRQLLDELEDGCRRAGAAFLPDPDPDELVALWRQ